MKNILEDYVKWMGINLERKKISYSDNKQMAHIADEYDEDDQDILEIVEEKILENSLGKKFNVFFIKYKIKVEKSDEFEDFGIYAFIKIDDKEYIGLEYIIEDDDYGLRSFNCDYVFGYERKDEERYFSDKLKTEIRDIIKQSHNYIELNQKKRITRLFNLEKRNYSIRDIKEFI